MPEKDDRVVEHRPEENRFVIVLPEGLAMVEYLLNKKNIIFTHTEVPSAYEGQGIGSVLAKHVLNYAKEQGYKVQALCPFIKSYIMRHPEYQANTWGFTNTP